MSDNKNSNSQTVAVIGIGVAAALGFAGGALSNVAIPSSAALRQLSVPASKPGVSTSIPDLQTFNTTLSPIISLSAVPCVALPSGSQFRETRENRPATSENAEDALFFKALLTRPALKLAPPPATPEHTAPGVPVLVSAGSTQTVYGPPLECPIHALRQAKPLIPATVLPSLPMHEPDLAGTLLGEIPSAVLRLGKQIVTVPVGGTIQQWKVMRVGHGEAVLKGLGRTLRLGLDASESSSMVSSSEEPSDSFASEDSSVEGTLLVKARSHQEVNCTPLRSAEPETFAVFPTEVEAVQSVRSADALIDTVLTPLPDTFIASSTLQEETQAQAAALCMADSNTVTYQPALRVFVSLSSHSRVSSTHTFTHSVVNTVHTFAGGKAFSKK